MPIHRGLRLDDMISRLTRQPIPLQANIYKTWPNLAIGVAVLGAASPGGAWVEFISAANAPTVPFTVVLMGVDGNGTGVVEIGVGGAGAEVAVANVPNRNGVQLGIWVQPVPLPIIPGGSRVSLRMVGNALNSYFRLVSALLPTRRDSATILSLAGKFGGIYGGVSPASSSVTGNPVSGASWTYGSYAPIISAAVETNPLILMSHNVSPYPFSEGQVALAYGGAGSETVFAELPTAWAEHALFLEFPVPILVPGSTRLAAKFAAQAGATIEADYNAFGCIRGRSYP